MVPNGESSKNTWDPGIFHVLPTILGDPEEPPKVILVLFVLVRIQAG
jgi:hypothetical protein